MKPVPADLAPPVVASVGASGSSFEDFYRAQAGRVYRALAATLIDTYLAREATDEAMARACARWRRVSELDNPGGWVYRVGLNWATSWWRKVGRERSFSVDDHGGLVPPVEPGTTAALVALRGLSTPHRAVVVCRVLLDLSVAETAAVLGISEGTVKSRLARALAALRTALSEES